MQLISEWVINIIIFILLAMIIDMLLPQSNIRKYVKVVTGLLLIVIIITPIFKLLSTDVDDLLIHFSEQSKIGEERLENELKVKKTEIETSQHAYILEQMAVQMKEQVEEEMIDTYGMNITSIHITTDNRSENPEEQIKKVTVYMRRSVEEDAIVTVKPVIIQVKDEQRNESASHINDEVVTLLSKEWDVPENKIEVIDEGRSRSQ